MTGASGYIGGRLARALIDRGWAVHALTRKEASAPAGVIAHRYDGTQFSLDAALSAVGHIDVVFHLASLVLAAHRPNDLPDLVAANVTLPLQLMEAMTAAGIQHLINTGTHWQHADGDDSYAPFSLYAATKQAEEALAQWYVRERGLQIITLKLFDVFGPGDPRKKVVSLLIDAAMTGEQLPMSPGHQQIDLVHVDDVVRAYDCAAALLMQGDLATGSFAVRSGETQTLRELAALVQDVSGRRLNIDWGRLPYRPNQIMNLWPKARDLPGWQPNESLRRGIAQLIDERSPAAP